MSRISPRKRPRLDESTGEGLEEELGGVEAARGGDDEDWRLLPHDEVFWYGDGSLILIASGVAFKVYRRPFVEQSPVFRDMFSLPQGVQSTEGTVDDHPIDLHGVTAAEFSALLRVLYP